MAKIKYLTGSIDAWFGWEVQEALRGNENQDVRLILTSNGGSVAQAIAISDMLARHGNVTVEFSGIVASAATWLAFGAKNVVMHEDTLWLCHQSSTPVVSWENMNADELDAYIQKLQNEKKSLEVIDAIIAKKYLDRCKSKGKNLKDVLDLMKEERYLAPADCLAWGFVDELLPSKAQNVVNQAMLDALHLPAMAKATVEEDSKPIATPTINEDSLIAKFVDKIKEIFKPAQPEQKKEENVENHSTKVMNKVFKNVMALLVVDALTETDEQITLSKDQMTSIENRLAAAAAAESALDAISDKVKTMNGLENKVAALSLVIDRIPTGGMVIAQPAVQQKDEKGIEIENADEINEFVKGFARK